MNYSVQMPSDPKKYTGRDVINISKNDLELTYRVISKFVFNEDGANVPHDDAFEYLLDLSIGEFETIMTQFNNSVHGEDSKN